MAGQKCLGLPTGRAPAALLKINELPLKISARIGEDGGSMAILPKSCSWRLSKELLALIAPACFRTAVFGILEMKAGRTPSALLKHRA